MNIKTIVVLILCVMSNISYADIKIASTTSTENSGLFEYIIPIIEKNVNDKVKVIAVGTGQALNLGENGDVDLLIVHAPNKEKTFIKEGFGQDRKEFMYNKFIIIGPKDDQAKVKGVTSAVKALSNIAKSGQKKESKFISRGDSSGTHFKELELWQNSSLSPVGDWYLQTGSGMGATLNIAASTDAYTLADSSTWLKFNNKQNLQELFSDDKALFNQYSVILIPKTRFKDINYQGAKKVSDWLVSDEGQKIINSYKINNQQAFIANAKIEN